MTIKDQFEYMQADLFATHMVYLMSLSSYSLALVKEIRSVCEDVAGCELDNWSNSDVLNYASLALKYLPAQMSNGPVVE